MVHFISSMLRLLGNGLRSVACAVACLLNEIALAMPMSFHSSAIALSYLDASRSETTKGGVARAPKKYINQFASLQAILILSTIASSASATIINNTATVNHTIGTAAGWAITPTDAEDDGD
ncbi:hypothetical protein, partial [Kaarinaea lacus]